MPALPETRHLPADLRNAAVDDLPVTVTGAEAARIVALVQRLQVERDEFAQLLVDLALAEAAAGPTGAG